MIRLPHAASPVAYAGDPHTLQQTLHELISMAEYKISFADADFDAAMMSLEMHNLLATPSFEAALIQMD